jgi:hypothetical protein
MRHEGNVGLRTLGYAINAFAQHRFSDLECVLILTRSILRDREAPFKVRKPRRLSKGNPVKISEPGCGQHPGSKTVHTRLP